MTTQHVPFKHALILSTINKKYIRVITIKSNMNKTGIQFEYFKRKK